MNATKNYLLRVAAHNLGRMMFKLFGLGKPRMIFSFLSTAKYYAVCLPFHIAWHTAPPQPVTALCSALIRTFHQSENDVYSRAASIILLLSPNNWEVMLVIAQLRFPAMHIDEFDANQLLQFGKLQKVAFR